MASSERIPVSIYQINLSRFPDHSFAEIIGTIIETARANDFQFESQPLARNFRSTNPVHVYHCQKSNPPNWHLFMSNILDSNAPLRNRRNTTQSFLCFVECAPNLFVISGGQGNFVIQPYVEDEFGLEILTRLIDKDSKAIKSLQDRGLTGIVLGQTKFFRGDQKFSDEDQFGKIFKLVQAELNRQLLTRDLGFSTPDLKRNSSGCMAKSAFELKKAINFDTMLRLMGRFNDILRRPKKFSLNNMMLVSNRTEDGKLLREELDRQFITILYQHCLRNTLPDFDFCHPKFEEYLTASSYQLIFAPSDIVHSNNPFTLKRIIDLIREHNRMELEDYYHFKQVLLHFEVQSSDEEGIKLTRGDLYYHLHGEITFNNRSYFRIDREWYRVDPGFITNLNAECSQMLSEAWDDQLIQEAFTIRRREREFNEQFIGQNQTLVFDTVTPENIEACDIMKWDNEFVYVIHVKKGFDTSMRDLAAQVSISAKRIRSDKHSDGSYLQSLQTRTVNGSTSTDYFLQRLSSQRFPTGGISQLIRAKRDKEIVFCLAFVDDAAAERSLRDNIAAFNSNIAKYALIELQREVRGLGFDFRVIQLRRN